MIYLSRIYLCVPLSFDLTVENGTSSIINMISYILYIIQYRVQYPYCINVIDIINTVQYGWTGKTLP